MLIRKADICDIYDLKELYFNHLTKFPPVEQQNMEEWASMLQRMKNDNNTYLLVVEENNGMIVSTVQMVIIDNLTHNLRPFAVIENVVTHAEYRNRGYATALLQRATEIARERKCYKIFLETGSDKESTLNFYRNNGFLIDPKHSCLKRL